MNPSILKLSLQLTLFALASSSLAAFNEGETCHVQFANYFSKDLDSPALKRFINLQGQVTLNRLAWSYLKLRSQSAASFEQILNTLVPQANLNPEVQTFAKRSSLGARRARVLKNTQGALQTKMQELFGKNPANQNFVLQDSDIEFLSNLENSGDQYGYGKSGVMNFVSMIDAEYHLDDQGNFKALSADDAKQGETRVAAKLTTLQRELDLMSIQLAKDAGCPPGPIVTTANLLDCRALNPPRDQLDEWSRSVLSAVKNPAVFKNKISWGQFELGDSQLRPSPRPSDKPFRALIAYPIPKLTQPSYGMAYRCHVKTDLCRDAMKALQGLPYEDPLLADLLKNKGVAVQHLGDSTRLIIYPYGSSTGNPRERTARTEKIYQSLDPVIEALRDKTAPIIADVVRKFQKAINPKSLKLENALDWAMQTGNSALTQKDKDQLLIYYALSHMTASEITPPEM